MWGFFLLYLKIFIDNNTTFTWLIPILIVLAFSGKGLSLYLARLIIIRVGEEVSGELKKQIADNIIKEILSRLEFLDNVGLNYLSLSRNATTFNQ